MTFLKQWRTFIWEVWPGKDFMDFFYFEKIRELSQWIMLISGISIFWSNSMGIRFWNFLSAWVALICVGDFWSKGSKMSEITFPTSWAYQTRKFDFSRFDFSRFDFSSTRAISTPVKSIFGRNFFPRRPAPINLVSKCYKFKNEST